MYMRLTFVTFSYFLNVLGSNVAFKGNTTWVMRVCVCFVTWDLVEDPSFLSVYSIVTVVFVWYFCF